MANHTGFDRSVSTFTDSLVSHIDNTQSQECLLVSVFIYSPISSSVKHGFIHINGFTSKPQH